jgi:hypothetical protein
VVEGGFEELVLQHQPLRLAQSVIDLRQAVGEPVLPATKITLSRVVGAVGEPDLQITGPGLIHDLDALEVVINGFATYGLIDVGQAAELVDVVLNVLELIVPSATPRSACILPQSAVVLDLVPRNVQRDLRCEPVSSFTFAASAIFSCTVLGVPGEPKTLKRVPELPNAHEGSSMTWWTS